MRRPLPQERVKAPPADLAGRSAKVIIDSTKDWGPVALNILLYLRPVERGPAQTRLTLMIGLDVLACRFLGMIEGRMYRWSSIIKQNDQC